MRNTGVWERAETVGLRDRKKQRAATWKLKGFLKWGTLRDTCLGELGLQPSRDKALEGS